MMVGIGIGIEQDQQDQQDQDQDQLFLSFLFSSEGIRRTRGRRSGISGARAATGWHALAIPDGVSAIQILQSCLVPEDVILLFHP